MEMVILNTMQEINKVSSKHSVEIKLMLRLKEIIT